MNRLCKWKYTILTCVLAVAVGVLHGMTHVEFYEYYSQFLDDIDKLCELTADYVSHVVVRLGYSKKSDKLKTLGDHYSLMMYRAQPLFTLFDRDLRELIIFMDNLESAYMIKKFLYSYFRQSAINLIDHLKRVYDL